MTEASIPASITQGAFLNAVKPLMDLLGTSSEAVYADIPIVIDLGRAYCDSPADHEGQGSITFATAAGASHGSGRPEDYEAADHPQGNEHAALAHMVRVQVVFA